MCAVDDSMTESMIENETKHGTEIIRQVQRFISFSNKMRKNRETF